MQEMRKLVTDIRIHQWSGESSISRFQFSAQSIHFVLTCAYDIIRDEYITNKEKIRRIWEGITEATTLDEDKRTAERNLETFLDSWRRYAPTKDSNVMERIFSGVSPYKILKQKIFLISYENTSEVSKKSW